VFTSKYNSNKEVAAFEINFFFACIGFPLMLSLCILQNELPDLTRVYFDPAPEDKGLPLMILLSGCFGIVITMTSILTVTTGGPLAINIAGILKDVGLTYAGFLFFDDVKATISVLIGLALSFSGALVFLGTKYNQIQE
jgi:hypothetical protein